MKQREIFATYGEVTVGALGRIMKDEGLNTFTKAELLCEALPTNLKELARGLYRNLVLIEGMDGATPARKQIKEGLGRLQRLGLERPLTEAMEILPAYSLGLEFTFILTRPYLSRDDDAFYIIDNPVRKEKVFKVPYLAPTSWKGSLRAAATRLLGLQLIEMLKQEPEAEAAPEIRAQSLWPRRAQAILLFGNENEVQARYLNSLIARALIPFHPDLIRKLGDEFDAYLKNRGYRTEIIEGRQGRLFFFPSFFNDLGLEIINPHDRRRRVGINPILYECVPIGAQSCFRLLYVPFDFPGELAVTPDLATLVRQVTEDLPLVAEAIRELFLTYGFGAKTSSGYGVAADQLPMPGKILLKAQLSNAAGEFRLPDRLQSAFGPYDGLDDVIDPAAELRSSEDYTQIIQQRGETFSRKKRQLYNKVRDWWKAEGKTRYQEYLISRNAGVSSWEFSCLTDLPARARDLAAKLQSGGET